MCISSWAYDMTAWGTQQSLLFHENVVFDTTLLFTLCPTWPSLLFFSFFFPHHFFLLFLSSLRNSLFFFRCCRAQFRGHVVVTSLVSLHVYRNTHNLILYLPLFATNRKIILGLFLFHLHTHPPFPLV